jgi:hypothetical protein
VPLALADDDRAELARWSQCTSPMLAKRARIVLACAKPGRDREDGRGLRLTSSSDGCGQRGLRRRWRWRAESVLAYAERLSNKRVVRICG